MTVKHKGMFLIHLFLFRVIIFQTSNKPKQTKFLIQQICDVFVLDILFFMVPVRKQNFIAGRRWRVVWKKTTCEKA